MITRVALLGAAAAFVGVMGFDINPAEALIKCRGPYQLNPNGLIRTPYCEDNYLALIAGYKAHVIRTNPSAKDEACNRVGHDIRVRDICLGHGDDPDYFQR